jgi:hypothetical protein
VGKITGLAIILSLNGTLFIQMGIYRGKRGEKVGINCGDE